MTLKVNNNYFFQYQICESLFETIEHYKIKIGRKRVSKVLSDHSVIFESLVYGKDSDSNHEDLIDAGYVLGRVQAEVGGIVLAVPFEGFRYFYVGQEHDLCVELKHQLKKEADHTSFKVITKS